MSFFQTLTNEMHKLKEIRLNRNIISYLICVIIASILWFLNALNKDYSAELSFPVKYINFPEGKYPAAKLPSQMQLEVKAKGFALLGYRIKTSFLPITFNVSTYSNHLQENKGIYEYTLNTDDIKDKIGSQLSSDIKLVNIYPEEIIFKFATSKCKKIAIHPDLIYTLKRQYILNNIITQPDSIEVCGPAFIVDTLQYISTESWQLKELKKNTDKKLTLIPIPDCYFKEKSVEVSVEVEQFTEAKRTIPVTPTGVPDSMLIRLFPSSVNISYEVGLSKYEKISDKDFVFSVDYPKAATTNYLEINVNKQPGFIKNLSYSPQKVEYILEKK